MPTELSACPKCGRKNIHPDLKPIPPGATLDSAIALADHEVTKGIAGVKDVNRAEAELKLRALQHMRRCQ